MAPSRASPEGASKFPLGPPCPVASLAPGNVGAILEKGLLEPEDKARQRRTVQKVGAVSTGLVVVVVLGLILWRFLAFGVNGGSIFVSVVIGVFGLLNLWICSMGVRALRKSPPLRVTVGRVGVRIEFVDGSAVEYTWASASTGGQLFELNIPRSEDRVGMLMVGDERWIRLSRGELADLLGFLQPERDPGRREEDLHPSPRRRNRLPLSGRAHVPRTRGVSSPAPIHLGARGRAEERCGRWTLPALPSPAGERS